MGACIETGRRGESVRTIFGWSCVNKPGPVISLEPSIIDVTPYPQKMVEGRDSGIRSNRGEGFEVKSDG